MNKSDLVHSVSSTRTYERCPARYRFAYLDRTQPSDLAPNNWRFGSIVHEGLEAGYRHRWIHDSSGTMLDCLPAALRAIETAWHHYEMRDAAGLSRAKRIAVEHLLDERIDGRDIAGVEELLADDTADGLRVAGYADLILLRAGTVEIRDHKVTRHERTREQLAADFQLNIYGWLARRRWPHATTIVGAHSYPLSGKVVTVELTERSTRNAFNQLRTTALDIHHDDRFDPAPGEHCGSCRWLTLCDAGRSHPISR